MNYVNINYIVSAHGEFIVNYVCFLEKNEIKIFNGPDSIKKFLEFVFAQGKKNTYVLSGDLLIESLLLIDYLYKKDLYFYEILFFDLNVYNLKIFYNGCCICFFCFSKLWPNSLKNISSIMSVDFFQKLSALNLKKILTENRFKLFLQNNEEFDNTFLGVRIILTLLQAYQILEKFFANYQLSIIGNCIYSASSFALKCFFKKFNNFNIRPSLKNNVDLFVREGYFGGRNEVFGNPDDGDHIYNYDFIGMYGQCMEEEFPIDEGGFEFNLTNTELPGFYDITFNSIAMQIPVLPYRDKEFDKVMFCNGIMRGTYWFEEINLFLKKGGVILKIHAAYIFQKTACVFKPFVQDIKNLKEKNEVFRKLGKIYINSFYGRLAMREKNLKTTLVGTQEEYSYWSLNEATTRMFKLNNIYVVEYNAYFLNKNQKKKKNLFKSNAIYAGIITAKARIKLYMSFEEVQNLNGIVLYCDTDGVFASFKNPILLDIKNTKLGNKAIDDAVFISPRAYAVKYKDMSEVVSKNHCAVNIVFDNLKQAFFNESAQNPALLGNIESTSTKNFLSNQNSKRVFLNLKKKTRAFFFYKGVFLYSTHI